MKSITTTFTTIIAVMTLDAVTAQSVYDKQDKSKIPDTVDFTILEIPAEYLRASITDREGREIKGQLLRISRQDKTVTFKREDGQEFTIAFDKLSAGDRRYAELETGIHTDIYTKDGKRHEKPIAYTYMRAWIDKLQASYTPEEILDHLRCRTITSAFVYEFEDDFFKANPKAEPELRYARLKNIELRSWKTVMLPPPSATELNPNERVSLKANIQKLGIRPFEETIEPGVNRNTKKPMMSPADGLLQAWLFAVNYKALTQGKSKLKLSEVLKKSESLNHSWLYESYYLDGLEEIISTNYGWKKWTLWSPQIDTDDNRNKRWLGMRTGPVRLALLREIAKQRLRDNQLTVTELRDSEYFKENGSPATNIEMIFVLTGFTREKGKETTYDGIVIEGSRAHVWDGGPYKIYQKDGVPESQVHFMPLLD